jgi:hypothetical protein
LAETDYSFKTIKIEDIPEELRPHFHCQADSMTKKELRKQFKRLGDHLIEQNKTLKVSNPRITDHEHREIIESYCEGASMGKIAEAAKRSNASIFAQVKEHNINVESSGFCPKCGSNKREIRVFQGLNYYLLYDDAL